MKWLNQIRLVFALLAIICYESVAQPAGYALQFDGTDDYVDLPESASLTTDFTNQITMEAWVYSSSFLNASIISSGNQNDYAIATQPDGKLRVDMYGIDISSGGAFFSSASLTPNTWYHVAVTYDSIQQAILINGIIDTTRSASGNFAISGQAEDIRIGSYSGSGPNFFAGIIDEVRIWSIARTQSEIQQAMNDTLTGVETGLVGYWRFDEGSGSSASDLSSYGNHGTLVNGPVWIQQTGPQGLVAFYPFNGNANDESGNGNNGTVFGATLVNDRFGNTGKAYGFNGVDNSIQIPHSSSFAFSSTQQFTFTAWIKINSYQHQAIAFKGAASTPGTYFNEWAIAIEPDSTLRLKVNSDSVNSIYSYLVSSPSLQIDQWSQVTAVWDGVSAIMKLYLDGNEVGATAAVSQIVSLTSMSLHLGYVGDGPLDGLLDDISIYNRSLSAAEVDSLYHLGGWPFQQSTWQTTLTAYDGCGDTLRPIFGQASLATDCIDSVYGESELPPAPPAGAFDVRFLLPCSLSASLRDFRSDSLMELRWKLKLQACSQPITLRWDTTGFPSGGMHIRDPFGGILVNANMRTQTEIIVPATITELWIERTEEVCRTVTVHGGWNMISLPVSVPPNYYLPILPDAVSHPFRFTPSGYVADDTLDPGVGYWVKFDGDFSYSVCGYTTVDKQASVSNGWNMVGPFEDTVLTSQVTSLPGGIVATAFYHYFPPYQVVDTLIPGKGYWVKVNQDGTLYFSSSSLNPSARSSELVDEPPPAPPKDLTTGGTQPSAFFLEQNYPNPFNPSTSIVYALPEAAQVSLTIFDVLGREVAALVRGEFAPGYYTTTWNAEKVSSGIYIARLTVMNANGSIVYSKANKLVLMK
ncbi:MAG: LamG-like jellyroll fold domain-containing protein [Bacteroidota bacterium]